MLYMSGGGVQIFSMGIVFMLLSSPFKSVAGMNRGSSDSPSLSYFLPTCIVHSFRRKLAFAPFAPTQSTAQALSTLPLQKIVYIACNLLTLALGLWKCRAMGLLPTGTGDWLAFETRGPVECSGSFCHV